MTGAKKKSMRVILLSAIVGAVIGTSLDLLFQSRFKEEKDSQECAEAGPACVYDGIVSFIAKGCQSKWDGMDPADMDLSPVYRYCSPACGFSMTDIDGDGVEELLLGDWFEDSDYQIYDIFTYDKSSGKAVHLFKGGERDWCNFNGAGIVCEHGSNSASDSFAKYYQIEGCKMTELKNAAVDEALKSIHLNKFSESAKAENE